ncbi:hypothetical protein A0J61_09617, partial [Choanephora cucurbitarum]
QRGSHQHNSVLVGYPLFSHPHHSLPKYHAIHCLQIHYHLMMPETSDDPLSLFLNLLPTQLSVFFHRLSVGPPYARFYTNLTTYNTLRSHRPHLAILGKDSLIGSHPILLLDV